MLSLRKDEPDLFRPYDEDTIANELCEQLFPDDIPHKNVIRELMRDNLRTFQRRYNPAYDAVSRAGQRGTKAPTPRTETIMQRMLGVYNSRTQMPDGRLLGEWTWGEWRAEAEGLVALLADHSDRPDDELIGVTLD